MRLSLGIYKYLEGLVHLKAKKTPVFKKKFKTGVFYEKKLIFSFIF